MLENTGYHPERSDRRKNLVLGRPNTDDPRDLMQMTSEELDFDSESESGSDYSVTQTQLGVSDGPLETRDEGNPLVSRMGGRIAWLPSKTIPPSSASQCRHCSQQMELLVQIFAPLDQSPYDRLLLVWGCARKPCQKKGHGCIRAVRLLTYNARWDAKLEKKRKRQEAKEARQKVIDEAKAAKEQEEEAKRKANPFTSKGLATGGLFTQQANLFATDTVQQVEKKADAGEDPQKTEDSDVESDEEDEDGDAELAEEMAIKAALESNKREVEDWSKDAPAYLPAQYLNTYSEPSSSARAYQDSMESKKQLKKIKESGGVAEIKGWEAEKYESMMAAGIDETFERFVKRVGSHGKQVVRYEFGGVPLPFHAKGPTYDKLWPKRKPSSVTIGGESRDAGRTYSPQSVSPCALCGAGRIFELQLMPNLVNTLRAENIQGGEEGIAEDEQEKDAEKRRKREIEEALGHRLPEKPDADGITRTKAAQFAKTDVSGSLATRTGLKWSTAMIFVCENDCRGAQTDKGEIWSEEEVEIQFEHEI